MFDFDMWERWGRNEPDICNILRGKLINREIRKYAKNDRDLWIKNGWWRKVEMTIAKHSNPVGRMVCASRMMNLKLIELNEKLNGVKDD